MATSIGFAKPINSYRERLMAYLEVTKPTITFMVLISVFLGYFLGSFSVSQSFDYFLNQCIIAPDFCVRSNYCSVHVVWREVQEMMVEILGSKNLSVLAFENQKLLDNYLPDVAYE